MQINAKVSHAHNKLLYNKFQKEKLAKYKMCLELFKQNKKPLLKKKEIKMNSKDKYVHVFCNT